MLLLVLVLGGLLAWYFLTPVLFPVAVLSDRPDQLRLLYLNPMTSVIVAAKSSRGGWMK